MTTLRSGSATDVGRVRETNQDWLLDERPLFAVADGMGGHAGGEVASRTAVETLREAFGNDPSSLGLVEAVRAANLAVWERSRSEEELHGMGTTLTAAALVSDGQGDRLTLVNVGDSRAYIFREGKLSQLTDDHSVVEEMVRSGDLSAEEAAYHPQRHILTRALGIEPDVDVDTMDVNPRSGDRVLICSDGLSNEMGDSEIASVLRRIEDPGEAARELVRLARAYGGSDNITVLVVDVVDAVDPAPPGAAGAGAAATPGAAGRDTAGTRAGPDPAGAQEQGSAALDLEGEAGRGPAGEKAPGPDGAATARGRTALATASLPVVDTGERTRAVSYEQPAEQRSWLGRATAQGSPHRSRIVTVRVVAFLVVLLAVLAAAAAVVGWFAERSYYVGLSGNELVIYQGRPGGFLWFRPRVQERTSVTTADVLPSRVPDLRNGTEEPSLSAARAYVSNLVNEARSTSAGPGAPAPAGAGSQP
jgi:serine/threonine protein phosphatase PrpC